jgi:hypothetical protein
VDAYLEAVEDRIDQITAESDLMGLQRETAVNACASYRFPCEVAATTTLLLAMGLKINHLGIQAVRQAVGQDQTGTIVVPNDLITKALEVAGLDRAPGIISFEKRELLRVAVTSGFMDDPVNAASGNFVHTETDLTFPGFTEALSVERVCNSLATAEQDGVFGAGWSSRLGLAPGHPVRVPSRSDPEPDGDQDPSGRIGGTSELRRRRPVGDRDLSWRGHDPLPLPRR